MQNRIRCQVIKDTRIYKFRPDKNYGDGGGWQDITDPLHPVTLPKLSDNIASVVTIKGFRSEREGGICYELDATQIMESRDALCSP
ncbi:MAG: hypothetical protein ABIL70_00825 [candidate division WOR-3 bacterium]